MHHTCCIIGAGGGRYGLNLGRMFRKQIVSNVEFSPLFGALEQHISHYDFSVYNDFVRVICYAANIISDYWMAVL